MSNTLKLIERVRSTTESGTDYAVAKALDMTQSNLIEIKKGKRWPGPKSQIRMSDLLKIDLKDIVAFINEDKATSDAEKHHWRSVRSPEADTRLDAAATIAASLMLVLLMTFGGTSEVSAAPVYDATPYTLCAVLLTLIAGCAWKLSNHSSTYSCSRHRGLAGPIPRVIAVA